MSEKGPVRCQKRSSEVSEEGPVMRCQKRDQ